MVTSKQELSKRLAGLERVVAVMTYMRSGSGLMSSLLDSHPNVISTPDCILTGFYEFWDEYGHLPASEILSIFIDYYATMFDAREQSKCPRALADFGTYSNFTNLGPNQDECLAVDRNAFANTMIEIFNNQLLDCHQVVSRKLFFQALHLAYSQAIGQDASNPIIAYGLHIARPEIIQEFLKDFPQAKFLQMVRNPVSALASTFRSNLSHGANNPMSGIGVVLGALYHGVPVPLENAANWRALKLEDLHAAPRTTMEKLCDWIGIPWNESLLNSTVNGKQWWNERNTIPISGFSTTITNQRFEEFIPAIDRFRLNILLGFKSRVWAYGHSRLIRGRLAQFIAVPLVLFPFRLERISISASNDASTPKPNFLSRLRKSLNTFIQGRKLVLKAWLHCVRRGPKEVQVL